MDPWWVLILSALVSLDFLMKAIRPLTPTRAPSVDPERELARQQAIAEVEQIERQAGLW